MLFRRFSAVVLLMICSGFVVSTVHANESVYKQLLPSTAWIITKSATGSGVVIDREKRLVATNFHVVSTYDRVVVCFPQQKDDQLLAERQRYIDGIKGLGIAGQVISRDPKRDLAIVQLDKLPESAVAVKFATDSPEPGENVHSIGNPGASKALWVYTTGTVRQVYENTMRLPSGYPVKAKMVETQSPLNSGDSGGPVVNDRCELVAIAQSYKRNARLVSNNIDVSELRSLMGGEIKAVDARLKRALDQRKFSYSHNAYGLFKLGFANSGGVKNYVFVESRTTRQGNVEVRRIWAVAAQSKEVLPAGVANKLLRSNDGEGAGTWLMKVLGDQYAIVFAVYRRADCSGDQLYDGMREAFNVVADARSKIELDLFKDQGVKRLTGHWSGRMRDGSGGQQQVKLSLGSDGSFKWEDAFMTLRGKYQLDGNVIVTKSGASTSQLGKVDSVDAKKLVLTVSGSQLVMQRQAAASQTAMR